ncbi:MLV-related proviral Env polyprotein-like [Onychomys torridus]|uniref:MLV-related proviral Env polyprotein-like n=1 Tax=Onychomys torridus TaxID=38674 RepID=UPI00167F2FE8|nr:MLV-related proviral Env polyprotein-like [Onychomys torridus]
MRNSALTCLITWLALIPAVDTNPSPHLSVQQTWLIVNPNTGTIANSTSSSTFPKGAWFPDLYVDLCDIVGGDWDPSDQEPFPGYGCSSPGQRHSTRNQRFYVCPGHGRSQAQLKKCGGPGDGFCAAWGCESSGRIWWSPPVKDDLIKVEAWDRDMVGTGKCNGQPCRPCYDSSRWPNRSWTTQGGRCNGLKITFTDKGKKADWIQGKTWGLRLYRTGYDPATTFTIRLQIDTISPVPVGPNPVLPKQRPPARPTLSISPPKNPNVTIVSPTLVDAIPNATLLPQP